MTRAITRATLPLVLAGWLLLGMAASAQEFPGNAELHAAPRSLPALAFTDGDGRPLTLEAFRGRVVLLNLWATWCGPCRREMPSLDRVQAALAAPDFLVLALSIDRKGREVVAPFYRELALTRLGIYLDTTGRAPFTLGARGLPVTLLIDREGREVARVTGPLEWDEPAGRALIARVLGR
ncbi:MAG: TlpA family protein disulfide reductase [Alphaproteobacteria bacterium]|nr:TlpA family protein disulfide reductase [Alphaproteobacteria bacterium]